MSNLVLLVGCLIVGVLLRHFARVPPEAHRALNAVILHVSLPALTLRTLHGFSPDAGHLAPVLMPWVLFAIGAFAFALLGRWMKLSRGSVGALTLVGGLGNTSFVGLPMIEMLDGRAGLGLGLLIDQLGSYLILSTLGVIVATLYSGGERVSGPAILRRIVTFPPFVALAVALLLRPISMPVVVDVTLARLGDTLAPLALLSVGMQLRFDAVRRLAPLLSFGLGYKLIACPALVMAVLWIYGAPLDTTSRVSLIEAAMPPMIGAGIVATDARLDAPLASTLIGIGIPIGLATATLWHLLHTSSFAA